MKVCGGRYVAFCASAKRFRCVTVMGLAGNVFRPLV